ncbi:MAG: 1-deoxy-D-xylulose-5-phosphate reductoisomerase [Flavobacteriaceae bacterium TMED238]|jgi:1-deoxy-D-xylulose-5-phosphate reductoisomerase|nr:MAG: 1-deoxy-D-xylulose-5-phosphate reductoisomerase [Flavobacteriaceae bacterium TMED238]|tara:strand:+ start:177 stop:1349 length:1173 start_codon:yes stop_codon:yes gene_type:complete
MTKTISILGSTGSIGLSVFKIIEKKKNFFKINLLSANKNYNSICQQIIKYKPNNFVITNRNIFFKIKNKFKKKKINIFNNFNSLNQKNKTDITISAIPGIAGLLPTINSIKFTKKILIANKESVICGWELIKNEAKKANTKIIPVDSEHYSILKLLENHDQNEIKKIYITASGGPFLNYKPNQFRRIKPADALKHPKWKMGKKISVDSSTLMNKILELIEAQRLFNIPNDNIDILIHPNSLVHAIVQFKNGLTKFLYHETSMIIPIANAIFEKNLNIDVFFKRNKKLKSDIAKNLIFNKVDKKIFPIISLKDRLNEFPSTAIIINATNEILVEQFLNKKMPFLGIYKSIFAIMKDRNYKKYAIRNPKSIDQILSIDTWAKKTTLKLLSNI